MTPVFNKDSFNFPGTEDYATKVFTQIRQAYNSLYNPLSNLIPLAEEKSEDAEGRIKDT